MIKGNEKDCICEKPNGKHRRHCDAYRLSEFLKRVGATTKEIEENGGTD